MLRSGSLFAGVGGFDMGLAAAGFEITWQIEIDRDAVSVLERHYPHTPRWRDIRDVRGADLPPVDVICGGWPCQDSSVAGKRAGLAGARSGLFYEFVRIVREMREATGGRSPTFVVGENVAGLLSGDRGRDLARVVAAWAHLGALDIGWRVLDARWFGVAQRRRRVFFVIDFGGRRTASVLFEPTSGAGDLEACGEAGKGLAGDVEDGAGIVGTLSPGVHPGGLNGQDAYTGHLVSGVAHSVTASAGHHGHSSPRGDGGDNLIVAAVAWKESQSGTRESDVVGVLDANYGSRRHNGVMVDPVAFHLTQDPINGAESRALGAGNEHGCATVAVAISENQRAEVRETPYVRQLAGGGGKPGQGFAAVREALTVRRLTPRECERLQGWSDDWTRYRAGGSEIPDGPRYRMIGNGVVAPVARWIGERLRGVLTREVC